MPIINFRCKDCGDKFSELVNSRNKDEVKCPSCGSDVSQIYEGKCNSLQSSGENSSVSDHCRSCPMGCKH